MKLFFEKNKTMIVLSGILGILIILSFVIFLSNGSKKEEFDDIVKNDSKLEEKIQDINESKEFIIPPKVNNPFVENDKEETMKKISKKEEVNIPDLSNNSFDRNFQEETIKEIEKTQKPKDMTIFLKQKQKNMELIGSLKYFKYELKEYKPKDMFLDWYLIEDVNRNFIRFKDLENNYSYNLRF